MSKLKNTDAVNKLLKGDHKTQTKKTVGFLPSQKQKYEVGEEWTDENGQKWKQMEGYRKKISKFSTIRQELKSFKNCPKEICTCTKPGTTDLKMRAIHGMCTDCVVDMESQYRKDGKYEEYEKKIMKANAVAWMKQATKEMEIVKETIMNPKKEYDEYGVIEVWESTNKEDLLRQVDEQFEAQVAKVKEQYNITEEDLLD